MSSLRRRDFEVDEAEVSGSDSEQDEQIAPEDATDRAFLDDDTQLPEDGSFHRRITNELFPDDEEALTQDDREKGKEKEQGPDLMEDDEGVHEASQHLAPERDALRQVAQQLALARLHSPPAAARPVYSINRFWVPPPPEISPETAAALKKSYGVPFERTPVYPEYIKLYEPKAQEDHDRIESVPRGERIWKRSPWKLRIGTGPYQKSDRIPWLLHQFIPYGYQDGGIRDPEIYLKFDPIIAKAQFNAVFIPEQDRSEQVIFEFN